jgi:ABC-type lipoprotein export system ATPase subunit
MTDGQEILIDLADVSRSFDTPQGPRHILEQVSLQIPRGSFTVIRGQSGAGKTTLLRILGFLDSGFSGGYRFNGLDTTRLTTAERDDVRTDAVGFVFQDGRLLNHLSIGENIALPLTFRNYGGPEIAARLEQAASIAFRESERAAGIVTLSPGAASGGQQQRAAVARAMITAPDVILADEPTANLDETAKALVLAQLHRLHESGATVIVVSHDDIFFDTGTQYRLDAGRLSRIGAAPEGPAPTPPATPAPKPRIPLAGWWPRLAPKTLLRHALWGVIRRPLFTVLTLVSLMAAVCQVAIFTSLIGGLNVFVEQTITQGSRLNRITVKPRRADLSADDRFPLRGEITASQDVTAVSARRASSRRLACMPPTPNWRCSTLSRAPGFPPTLRSSNCWRPRPS